VPWETIRGVGTVRLAAYALVAGFGNRFGANAEPVSNAMPLKFAIGALGIGLLVGAFFISAPLFWCLRWRGFFFARPFGDAKFAGWRGMPVLTIATRLAIGIGARRH